MRKAKWMRPGRGSGAIGGTMGKKKQKKWMKLRHRLITGFLKIFLGPYCRLTYGVEMVPFREQGNRAYLILFNHTTAYDQFFVGMSFRGPVYYMATEDIFSMGWVSSLIRWLVEPIPIRKQTTDVKAVMNCIRVAREGGTIALAPEGNRTYSGRTGYMNPAIASLAKKLGLPIALYRIEGGYGVQPRWTDKLRRGKMKSYVARVIEPEEYANMTADQLMEEISKGLYVDEAVVDGLYKSNRRAEYMERALYVCPRCGFAEFASSGNHVSCKTCGMQVEYGEDKRLQGVGFDLPFEFMADWYAYQEDFVNGQDIGKLTDAPIFRDRADLSEVIVYERKVPLRQGVTIQLFGDRVVLDGGSEQEMIFPFAQTSAITVLGRNKMNIYFGDKIYQFKGEKSFNPLKYVHIYHRFKNIDRGNADGKFLGL